MPSLLLILIACSPGDADPAGSPVAGCSVVESRYAVWAGGGAPWQVREQVWDARGRVVHTSSEVLGVGDPGHSASTHDLVYDGDLLVQERDWTFTWTLEIDPAVVRQDHHYDARGVRVETVTYNEHGDGTETLTGHWSYASDGAGHLEHAEWDGNGDGRPDLYVDEVWESTLFGWHIDRTERFELDDAPLSTEVRELDTEERPVRHLEDWDADGTLERIEVWTYDDLGRVVAWELGGTAMLGQSCTWTFVGDDPAEMRCTDDVRPGTFVTTWRYPRAGRADLALVAQDAGEGLADTEAWSFDWSCPDD